MINKRQSINDANSKLDLYLKKYPTILERIPQAHAIVYNNTFYPIIDDSKDFLYLGGKNLYFILKSKCELRNTGESLYWEVIPSKEDILIGKSPIIPIGCPNYNSKLYPSGLSDYEIKL